MSQSLQNKQNGSLILQHSFAQKNWPILGTSTHSTLLKIYFRNTAKNRTYFTNFLANMFQISVRKNICIVPFLDSQPKNCILEALGKQMSAYSFKCPQENSRAVRSLYLVGAE